MISYDELLPAPPIAPNRIPAPTTPGPAPVSSAGRIREKKDAASMTPAAKPSRAFCTRLETLRTSRRGKAPKPVAEPAARLARKPVSSIDTLYSYPSIVGRGRYGGRLNAVLAGVDMMGIAGMTKAKVAP